MTKLLLPSRRAIIGAMGASTLAASARAASWAEGANALRIVVQKSARKLMLVRAGAAFASFPVSLGENPLGPKRQEGDRRTPEGRYFIDRYNEGSAYYRALHISYPNADDVRRARAAGLSPGGNIEIHGLPKPFETYDPARFPKDWTDGCISVSNRAMDEICKAVSLDTPVDILA